MIAAGILFELIQNATGDSNIVTAIFRKTDEIRGPAGSLMQERIP